METLKEILYLVLSIVAISVGAALALWLIRITLKPVWWAVNRLGRQFYPGKIAGLRDKVIGAIAWLALTLCIGALCWYILK